MSHRISLLFKFCALLSISLFSAIASGQTDTKTAAREIYSDFNAKVYGVKSLVKLEASFQGKKVMNREIPAYGIGTVISDGMLVVSYRTIKPKASANIQGMNQPGARGIAVETEVKEIKLIDESGEEFDAKLVLHDEDLDLAFVALDRESENADGWSCDPIDISQDIELNHLDDVVFISRAGESMRFQSAVRVGQVNTIIKRPRRLYSVNNLVLGGASFDINGNFVGLGIRKTAGTGGEFSVVLPAKYIRKLLPQAIEKAKETKSEEEAIAQTEEENLAEADGETEAETTDKEDEKETDDGDNKLQ